MQDDPIRFGQPARSDGRHPRHVQTMNPEVPSTSRLPPSTNYTPLTKEQIKRRTFWINLFLIVASIGIWVVAALIAINKHK